MHDSPYTAETSATYLDHVMQPLAKGEGVACFLATDDCGEPTVVFCTHVVEGPAQHDAVSDCERTRALHALSVQRMAREQAESYGFRALVG